MDFHEELIVRLKSHQISAEERASYDKGIGERNQFLMRFPVESLDRLTLDSYCIGKGDRLNFCWWLEFGTANCSRISCGQCDHYCVYYEKSTQSYRLNKALKKFKENNPDRDESSIAQELVFEPLSSFVKTKGSDCRIAKYLGEALLLKILILYYHDEFAEINSVKWLTKICEAFGLPSEGSFIEKNQIVKAFIDQQVSRIQGNNLPPQAVIAIIVDMLGLKKRSEVSDYPVADVKFWRMQLHPNDREEFTVDRILNGILQKHGVIGMGSEWSNDKGQPRQFEKDIKVGDVVAVMHGAHFIALVQVVGDCKKNNHETDDNWFNIVRPIKILSDNPKEYERRYVASTGRQANEGLAFVGTLSPVKKNRFIPFWYNSIKEMNMVANLVDMVKKSRNVVLTGAPGTGKTYLAREVAYALTGDNEEKHPHVEFVQFHPSFDYTDFVEGLRPIMNEGTNTIGFVRQDGIFKAFCKKAINEPKHKYVMIIDEINRGDISKIFGELFYSIDKGYRGEAGRVKTQYSNLLDESDEFKDGFYVPENVYTLYKFSTLNARLPQNARSNSA